MRPNSFVAWALAQPERQDAVGVTCLLVEMMQGNGMPVETYEDVRAMLHTYFPDAPHAREAAAEAHLEFLGRPFDPQERP